MVRDKLMARSGEERFVDSARKMARASLPSGLPEMEQRRELFRRTYGTETGIEKLIWF